MIDVVSVVGCDQDAILRAVIALGVLSPCRTILDFGRVCSSR